MVHSERQDLNALETSIRRLTQAVNGQFPRPWLTDMKHPEGARLFIVGYNQATIFRAATLDYDCYIDALFNRNGRSCLRLYERMRLPRDTSQAQRNLNALRECLASRGVIDVVQTNVICYSTPMARDLARVENRAGKLVGRQIFCEILGMIRPIVLIAHGARTTKELGRVLRKKLPRAASNPAEVVSCVRVHTQLGGEPYAPMVFVIPSLSPPKWNSWQKWAQPHLAETCARASEFLDDHPQSASGAQPAPR